MRVLIIAGSRTDFVELSNGVITSILKLRGWLEIIRETAHRGGKVVTVVAGFKGIGLPEKRNLARKIQKTCGVGGIIKGGRIEIRSDLRDEVNEIPEEAGLNPVFAGG